MKLSEEMQRAVLCLKLWRPEHQPTIIEFRRETYVGWQTLVALVKRGLFEWVLPMPQGDPESDRIARQILTVVKLTPAGEQLAAELQAKKKGRPSGKTTE